MKAGIVVSMIILLLLFCTVPCSGADSFDAYLVAKSDSEKYNAIASDEGNVAWVEYGSGTDSGYYSRTIYRYNVSSGRKELVIRDTSWKRDLAISGDRYVWSDGRGIFLYDDAQGKLTFLYSPNSQYSPCIYGDTVLWVETNEWEYSLVMYDVVSGTHHTVVSSVGSLDSPAISGDRVVYREVGPTNDLIILLNITTREKTVLCDEPGSRAMPAIDGDSVVWVDGRNGPYQVFLYDLKSRDSKPVSPSYSFQMYPDISGNLIVWEDYRNSSTGSLGFREGGGDIRLYDRTTNMTQIVAEGPFSLEFPRVSGEYVVWSDGRNDAHDIFLYHYSGNRTHNFLAMREGTGYSATPTTVPTPDTKVRHYSTISNSEIEWYLLEPSMRDKKISFELRWNNPASSLSLTLVSPGGSTWHFSDADDSRSDQAVRMTISGVNGGYLEPGKWTVAIAGDSAEGPVPYDLCWY
ncbi:MAG: hypothetical protein M0Q91_06455 [Methanoregula sp.]|nr:hypothetical protein [Methanoregula sp.]